MLDNSAALRHENTANALDTAFKHVFHSSNIFFIKLTTVLGFHVDSGAR